MKDLNIDEYLLQSVNSMIHIFQEFSNLFLFHKDKNILINSTF